MELKNRICIIMLCFGSFFSGYAFTAYIQDPKITRVFPENLKEKYSGNKYDYSGTKKKPNKGLKQGGNKTVDDYEEGVIKTREVKDKKQFFFNITNLKIVIYVILFLVILYFIYLVLNGGHSLFFFKTKNKTIDINSTVISSKNIDTFDIQALIRKAEKQSDFRLAIRYYYLLVLKQLNIKKIIQFEDDKTNTDYLQELNAHPTSSAFKKTAYLYTYIWYGDFNIDEGIYVKAKVYFTKFLNQIT